MKNHVSRRQFIQKTGLVTAFSLVPSYLFSTQLFSRKKIIFRELAVISGENIYQNTIKVVDALGGIGRFVNKGNKVGILVNSAFDNQGAYVNPDIPLSVIKLCFEQEASEVVCIQNIDLKYWQRSDYYVLHEHYIEKLNNSSFNKFPSKFQEEHFKKMDVEGISLQKVEIAQNFFDCDVLINISIAKHHATTGYTGALKNTMGVTTRDTNVTFHLNGPARNDPDYLAQCIADLNKLRKPDLTIIDASEVLMTNGPNGPGEILRPGKIVAGTDMVAADSLAATIIGHGYGEILSITKAWETGLGEMDFNKYDIFYA